MGIGFSTCRIRAASEDVVSNDALGITTRPWAFFGMKQRFVHSWNCTLPALIWQWDPLTRDSTHLIIWRFVKIQYEIQLGEII
jgi:hypothetical protein